jgi:hypothetical protein
MYIHYKFIVVWCKINMYIQYINLQDKSWITRYHTWYHRLSRTCIHTCYWNENQNWVDKLNMSRLVYKKYSDTSNIPYIFHIKQQFFKKIILQSIFKHSNTLSIKVLSLHCVLKEINSVVCLTCVISKCLS